MISSTYRECKSCFKHISYDLFYKTDTSCKECVKTRARAHASRVKDLPKKCIENKKCSKCNIIKGVIEFYSSQYIIDGFRSECKECSRRYNSSNEILEYKSQYRKKNKAKIREQSKRLYNKYKDCKEYRLRKVVSKSIYCALVRNSGSKHGESIFKYLPYTIKELIQHIESQWESWMSWDNYGKYDINKKTWQIDHIIPQSKLPFKSLEDDNFVKTWSLINLQPLETMTNLKKSNKI